MERSLACVTATLSITCWVGLDSLELVCCISSHTTWISPHLRVEVNMKNVFKVVNLILRFDLEGIIGHLRLELEVLRIDLIFSSTLFPNCGPSLLRYTECMTTKRVQCIAHIFGPPRPTMSSASSSNSTGSMSPGATPWDEVPNVVPGVSMVGIDWEVSGKDEWCHGCIIV